MPDVLGGLKALVSFAVLGLGLVLTVRSIQTTNSRDARKSGQGNRRISESSGKRNVKKR